MITTADRPPLPPAPDLTVRQKCRNAQPGSYGHECGRSAHFAITYWTDAWCSYPARWYTGFYCVACYQNGYEAQRARELGVRTVALTPAMDGVR